MTWPDPISISKSFRRLDGLAADQPCLIVAKRTKRSDDLRRKQFEREQQPKIERYLRPLRTEVGEGAIYLTTLADFAAGRPTQWTATGPEPHDALFTDGMIWAAFCGSLRAIDPRSGTVRSTISSTRFTNLHSLSLSPRRDYLLVANTGLDEILELNYATRQLEWAWRPTEHGWNIGPFGVAIVSDKDQARAIGCEAVDATVAQARLRSGVSVSGWAIVANPKNVGHSLGLEKWQRVAEPNWAGYEGHASTILCSSFCGDSILRIERSSGRITQQRGGYLWPHAILEFGNGAFVVTDTGRGHVHFVDGDLEPQRIYSFAELPVDEIGASGREWLQFTTPLNSDGMFISIDARRSKIFVWSPQDCIYSEYLVPRSILVKSVQAAYWARNY